MHNEQISSSRAIPIAEREPVFPCWVYAPDKPKTTPSPNWRYFDADPTPGQSWEECGWTHWLPDQPGAPTARPSQPAAPDMAALKVFRGAFPVRAGHCKPDEVVVLVDQFNAVADKRDALVVERDAAVKALAGMTNQRDDQVRRKREGHDTIEKLLTASREREGKLAAYLKAARCPDPNCDGKGSSWCVSHDRAGEPEQVQFECQWCRNTSALLTPPPAGTEEKG